MDQMNGSDVPFAGNCVLQYTERQTNTVSGYAQSHTNDHVFANDRSPSASEMERELWGGEVEDCGKRSYNYKAHSETHDQRREYPFHCEVSGCDKKFNRKTDLHRHHQSVHMKERNHGCTFCGRLFARKDTLRR
ncbi:hypothetical protein A9K55_000144 [Cordyceps militaris]|uniref:C2H2-type domain-containing protein n=1 Tax=Cordyceps militaris TaxID=73501 RepID=A0A2H4SVF7_CORMI|nr:hypothetical protein A9K55_000144 [Cordyceps militaris]